MHSIVIKKKRKKKLFTLIDYCIKTVYILCDVSSIIKITKETVHLTFKLLCQKRGHIKSYRHKI